MLRIAKRTLQAVAAAGALGALAAAPAVAADPAAYTTKGAWSFASAPNLHPPKLHTDRGTVTKALSPGYFFATNFKDLTAGGSLVGQSGPMILDSHLQPVWFLPVGTKEFTNNLVVQTYNGKPALSWWQGVITSTGATTSGSLYVVDQHYRQIGKPLSGADGWTITQHEALISGHNVWVTSIKPETMDLSSVGGPSNGVLLNSAVQKYDLTTGKLIYSWAAAPDPATKDPGHVPLADSYQHPPQSPGVPWDAFHLNSIQLQPGGFITSMRNTWSAYAVNATTGATNWILGGKRSSFGLPANAQFQWQHDVKLHSGSLVTVFNDNCCEVTGPAKFAPPHGTARAMLIKLDFTHKTGSLVHQWGRGILVGFQGNADLQRNGNIVVGWGSRPYFSEFSKTGRLLLDAVFPTPDLTYRVVVSNWVGKPFFPPSGAARNKGSKSTVYASWDGATQVARWRVLAGTNAKHLVTVATQSKNGFETAIALSKKYSTYKVQALDSRGHVLPNGTSKPFSASKSTAPKNSGSSGGSGSNLVGFY